MNETVMKGKGGVTMLMAEVRQGLFFWRDCFHSEQVFDHYLEKMLCFRCCSFVTPGGYSDLVWTGVCCLSLKTLTHL